MADAPKLDIFDGSSYRKSLTSQFRTRAVRRGRITGLDGDNQDLSDAVEAIIQQPGIGVYQGDTTLPLESVEARQYGENRAWVRAEYRRTPFHSQGTTNGLIASVSDVVIPTECFNSTVGPDGVTPFFDVVTGLPEGVTNLPAEFQLDPTERPRAWYWQRRGKLVIINTVLSQSPDSQQVSFFMNRINLGDVQFQGALGTVLPGTFGPKSVLFKGSTYQAIESPASVSGFLYPTRYKFIILNGQWFHQEARFVPGTGWNILNVQSYEAADFTAGGGFII